MEKNHAFLLLIKEIGFFCNVSFYLVRMINSEDLNVYVGWLSSHSACVYVGIFNIEYNYLGLVKMLKYYVRPLLIVAYILVIGPYTKSSVYNSTGRIQRSRYRSMIYVRLWKVWWAARVREKLWKVWDARVWWRYLVTSTWNTTPAPGRTISPQRHRYRKKMRESEWVVHISTYLCVL